MIQYSYMNKLIRLQASKGGIARANALTPNQLHTIAIKASNKRWQGHKQASDNACLESQESAPIQSEIMIRYKALRQHMLSHGADPDEIIDNMLGNEE